MVALPYAFFDTARGRHSGFAITLLSEMALMSIFALSYNMLGPGVELLSFGHAILFGIGAYCVAHMLNFIKATDALDPLEPGAAVRRPRRRSAACWPATSPPRQRATAFAMITMGLGELLTAAALMFMTFFGGEGGITTDRVIDASTTSASPTASRSGLFPAGGLVLHRQPPC